MNNTDTSVEMTAAEVVWTMLQEEGVDHVFGVCGITNVPLLHALRQMQGMRFIHATHESAALGMADGYSRTTGKLAVVVVHSTGGLSNSMGNLHNAYAAGSRILVLVGQTDAPLDWSERYMDVNFRPMVSQVSNGCWMVTRAQDVAVALNRAIKEASTPPTGPVVLAIPGGIQAQTVRHHSFPSRGRRISTDISPCPESLETAGQLLAGAERPVIIAGRATADANAIPELVSLADTLAAPVYTGNETKQVFPSDHPLYRGIVFQRSDALRRLAASADVLLTIGSDLFKYDDATDTPIVSADTRVIQIDLDAHALARFCPTEVALLANPKIALGALNAIVSRLISRKERDDRLEQLTTEHRHRKAFVEACLNQDFRAVPIRWGAAFKEIAAALPEGAVIVDELASFYGQLPKVVEFREPGSYFATCDSLGWGLHAALGVALGNARRPVIAMLGDGGAMFCVQALWTAARYQIPAVMVIFNNGGFGSMRGLFTMYGQAVGSPMDSADCATYDIGELSFAKLAADFGIEARRVTDPTAIRSVMKEMIALRRPAVVELMVSPDGAGMNELTTEFFK